MIKTKKVQCINVLYQNIYFCFINLNGFHWKLGEQNKKKNKKKQQQTKERANKRIAVGKEANNNEMICVRV